MLRFFLQNAKGSIFRLIISVSLSTLTILSSVCLMGVSAYLIILAGFHPSLAVLQLSIVGVRFFGISRSLFRYVERLASHNVNFEILGKIRLNLFDHMSKNFSKIMDKYTSSDLFSVIIQDIDKLENLFIRIISPWLVAFITSLFVGLFFGLHSFEILFIYLIGFVVVAVILPIFSARNSENSKKKLKSTENDYFLALLNFHQFLPESVFYNAKTNLILEVNEKADLYCSKQRINFVGEAIWNNLNFFITQLIFLSLLIASCVLANDGKLDSIMVGILSLVALSSFEIVTNLPANSYQFSEINNSIKQISNIQEIKTSSSKSESINPENLFPIKIENVTYQYQEHYKSFELKNINLEINKGEKIAIIGPNGAGKSTLIELLSGNREDFSGSIKFNDIPIERISKSFLRTKINKLSASSYFFNTTIRNNLLLANKKAEESELYGVMQKVNLHSVPEIDLDTTLDEMGKNLSSGESQRLAFAQLLLQDGDLIILDEPFANLDPRIIFTFQNIIDELSKQKTIILITHDFSKLQTFDKVVIMDTGRIKKIIPGDKYKFTSPQ